MMNEIINSGSEKFYNDDISSMIPPVHFEGFNTYLPTGEVVTYPSHVYDTFGKINARLLTKTLVELNKDNLEFSKATITGVIGNTLSLIVNNFFTSIDSRYKMFIRSLNEFVYHNSDITTTELSGPIFKFNFSSSREICYRDELSHVIDLFLFADSNLREEYYHKMIYHCILIANHFGSGIYNDVRSEISLLLSSYNMSADNLENMYRYIDSEFSMMMQDFTFEALLFVKNLQNAENILPTQESFNAFLPHNIEE